MYFKCLIIGKICYVITVVSKLPFLGVRSGEKGDKVSNEVLVEKKKIKKT